MRSRSWERSLGACSFCGVLRRRALNEAAKQVDADRLATGHTLDDMAQSALLNLLRGDVGKMASLDPGGFTSPGFVRRIKPLCEVPERETTLYAYLQGFELQSTPCPYAGEAMRGDARTFLGEMETRRPGTLFTTYNTALKLIPEYNDHGGYENMQKMRRTISWRHMSSLPATRRQEEKGRLNNPELKKKLSFIYVNMQVTYTAQPTSHRR